MCVFVYYVLRISTAIYISQGEKNESLCDKSNHRLYASAKSDQSSTIRILFLAHLWVPMLDFIHIYLKYFAFTSAILILMSFFRFL